MTTEEGHIEMRLSVRRIAEVHARRAAMLLALLAWAVALGSGCATKPPVATVIPPEPEVVRPEPPPAPELPKVDQWRALVREQRATPLTEQLAAVNAFFNAFETAEDIYVWGTEDYWATLPETLEKERGDCEDLTLAKYFTLRELSIADERLRITYVISLKTGKPHMVLTCCPRFRSGPLVLDTLHYDLLPVSARTDLVPVYSFNGSGYWLARREEQWLGERIGDAGKLSLWRDVLERMERIAVRDFASR